tara:strand:- start:730 stop:1503 length:774 start_codon:yes stop_codon:yes gene_type:complete
MEPISTVLSGLALIRASVSFVKENIGTVQDISGIAKQIDGFFQGEADMNKNQGKGLSIAQQFGSVESTASDFIDRKILEEQRAELKNLINLRFPVQAGQPSTWDQIIAERAAKISQAKETQKLQRIEARQKQKEIIDTVQTMGIVFCVVAVLVIGVVLTFKAYGKGKIYNAPKDYTRQQKIQRGEIVLPTMTTCRLMKQKVFKDKMACIYQGANKTYELEFTDVHIGCPRKYKCVLNPNGKEPSIDKVMESLRSIAK